MFNDYNDFNNIIKKIKIRNYDNFYYSEFDYIKEIEFEISKLIFKKRFLKKVFNKKYEIYKTNLNNRQKIEIYKTIKDSQIVKVIDYIVDKKKVDFSNISYIINHSKFILYSLDNNYIKKDKLELVRNYLVDMDFDKNYKEYYFLINNQKSFKNSLEELIGI